MLQPSRRTALITASLLLPHAALAAVQPLIIPFSGSFGPDGPWHALSVTVANNSQYVYLYPSIKAYASVIFSTDVCDAYSDQKDCPTYAGGLYDGENTNEVGGISWQEIDDGFSTDIYLAPNVLSAETNKKTAHIGADLYVGGSEATTIKIESAGFIRVDNCTYKLPGGSTYAPDLGWLSMGGPKTNQTFSGSSPIVLPVTLNWLESKKQVPSSAWGMHIGSASQNYKIDGSCVWGGYDSSRIAGPIATYDQNANEFDNFFKFQLNDISIGVAQGTNPLGYTNGTKAGLLTRDKGITASTSGSGSQSLIVYVHSEVPYLYLPRATCDAIAAELPVAYNSDYGLYIWDTTSTAYKNIIASPGYLGFNFQYKTSAGFNINVPFALLALELTYPITPKGQKLTYFPCRPYQPPNPQEEKDAPSYASYILGRAFLQAAFIGQSWNTEKYWMAQAPGPNGPTSGIVSIPASATTLDTKADDDAWVQSWASSWKFNTTTIPGGTTPTAEPKQGNNPKANTGAIAGGVVGGLAGLAAIVGAALAFLRRRRQKNLEDPPVLASANEKKKQNPADLPIPYDGHDQPHAVINGGYSQVPQGYYGEQVTVPPSAELQGSRILAELPGRESDDDGYLSPPPMPPPPPAQELEGDTTSSNSMKK